MQIKKFENEDSSRHYNREERLSMLSESARSGRNKKKGFFRNNKSLVIILADIILICLLFLGFLVYSKLTLNTSTDKNYSYTLKGYIYDSTALISLAVTNKSSDNNLYAVTEPKPVEITFTLSENTDFYRKIFDQMPDSAGMEKVFRVSVPVTDQYSRLNPVVYASIKQNDTIIRLKYSLRKEK